MEYREERVGTGSKQGIRGVRKSSPLQAAGPSPVTAHRTGRGGTRPAPGYIFPAFLTAFLPALALFFFALALPVVFFAIASPRFKATAARVRACLQHTQLARRLQ